MSDTPETDVSCGYALSSHYGRLEGSYLQMDWSGPFVHAEVARKLERERDKALEERDQFRSLNESYAACWDEIRAVLGESEQGDKTCDLDRVLKAICERDEARKALKCIDEAIFTMKPRHIGHPTMDGKYPCWSVWLPQCGRVERKSLQDALLEFVAQIKEGAK